MQSISFPCAVAKVTTMADGAFRVYLDLPETALMQAAELMACKRDGVYLEAVCTQSESCTDLNHEAEKRPEGSGDPVDCRRRTIRRD